MGVSGPRQDRDYALWMPKRSTPFQAIMRLVRQQLAQPGVTVTESKFPPRCGLGIERWDNRGWMGQSAESYGR
jgi:hypothetical protein